MIPRKVAPALLLLVLSSCAGPGEQRRAPAPAGTFASSAPAPPPGARPDDERADTMLICEMERPTGSNIAERVCHRATPAEMRRQRMQDSLAIPKGSPKPKKGGGT